MALASIDKLIAHNALKGAILLSSSDAVPTSENTSNTDSSFGIMSVITRARSMSLDFSRAAASLNQNDLSNLDTSDPPSEYSVNPLKEKHTENRQNESSNYTLTFICYILFLF